jgi:apolipoprotein N-acyltransferase
MVITALTWFVISITLSSFIGVWSLIAHVCLRRSWTDVLFLPFSWVLFEWVRMWGFNVITWGSGSVPVPYFSFGMLGLALARSNALLHLASFGGVYILSFFVALGGFLLWIIVAKHFDIVDKRDAYLLVALGVLFYVVLALIPLHRATSSLSVATIAMDVPATLTVSSAQNASNVEVIKAKLVALTAQKPLPDVIVIPEDMRFLRSLARQNVDPKHYLQSLFGMHEVLVIDSARVNVIQGVHARVSFFSSLSGEIAIRDKYIVIPFGEYIPTVMRWGLELTGMQDELSRDEANRNYLPGTEPTPVLYHGAAIIALVCSEMLSPSLYYETGLGNTNPIYVNLTSLSDFHHGNNPFLELRDMMNIQSIWGNAPYFQSSNGVPMVRIGG